MYGQFPQNAGTANVGRALHSNLFLRRPTKKRISASIPTAYFKVYFGVQFPFSPIKKKKIRNHKNVETPTAFSSKNIKAILQFKFL